MKTKSIFVNSLDKIQSDLSPLFKLKGFKRNGRSYNKTVQDGLVHVVGFQMGEFPIGDLETYVVPGLRENLYGKFALNLGVFIPNISFLEYDRQEPAFKRDYNCDIYLRLTEHSDEQKDQWFDLPKDPSETTKIVFKLIDEKGFPFLDKFNSLKDILDYFELHGKIPGLNTKDRSKFIISLIHYSQNNLMLFDKYIEDITVNQEHKGFKEHVEEVVRKLKSR